MYMAIITRLMNSIEVFLRIDAENLASRLTNRKWSLSNTFYRTLVIGFSWVGVNGFLPVSGHFSHLKGDSSTFSMQYNPCLTKFILKPLNGIVAAASLSFFLSRWDNRTFETDNFIWEGARRSWMFYSQNGYIVAATILAAILFPHRTIVSW